MKCTEIFKITAANQINFDQPSQMPMASPTDGKALLPTRRFCHHCGRYRFIEQSPTADSLTISIRVRGEIFGSAPEGFQTIRLPPYKAERTEIGQKIWRSFESFKSESDRAREAARCSSSSSVRLKEIAPVPWLRWNAPDGCKGQFRNQRNFEMWWTTNIVDEVRTERQGLQRLLVLFNWDSGN